METPSQARSCLGGRMPHCDLELLRVTRESQGKDFDWQRLRNTYWIDKERLSTEPPPLPLR